MEGHGNVVSLARMRSDLTPRPVAEIEAYWERLRAGRLCPARTELDPREMTGFLEWTFVLEKIAPGLGRIRIAGRRINDVMGSDMRGVPFSLTVEPAARPALSDALEAVFDAPAVVSLRLTSEDGIGRGRLDGRMILLPLRSDLGDVSRALGCLHYEGSIGRAPRRFAISDQMRRSLVGYGAAPEPAAQPVRAFAEDKAEFIPEPPARTTGKPHLRLVTRDESGSSND